MSETTEWFCLVCGRTNGRDMTAAPSHCMNCGLPRGSHCTVDAPGVDPARGILWGTVNLHSEAETDARLGAALRAALATVPDKYELVIYACKPGDRPETFAAAVHAPDGCSDDNAECRALDASLRSAGTESDNV